LFLIHRNIEWKKLFWPSSLKPRLIIMLLVSALIPLLLIGTISYISMHSILENKTERGVNSNLNQVQLSLENTLSQLNHVSQQLAFDGRVGKSLEQYLVAQSFEKKQLSDEIQSQLNLITFTNPNIGLTFYFFTDSNKYIFENFPVKAGFQIGNLPLLDKFTDITYYGPHPSLNSFEGNNVFSIVRKVELPERDDVYIYIETKFKLAESIMNNDQAVDNVAHLIVDHNGRIAYSQNPKDFPVGKLYPVVSSKRNLYGKYYLFEAVSNQTWKIVSAIPKSSYEFEINKWIREFMLFTVLSLAASFSFAWVIWRTVYRPLRMLSRNIRNVKNNNFLSPIGSSNILEFNVIHLEFENMRQRIGELIIDVEYKEKKKAQLEVEKLLHQINPHFIHNTLDTIRWLARANGQEEIDRLVSTLNKVLHYNLGKSGPAIIQHEIDALKNYMILQGIRYNFQFNVLIQADAEVLDLPIPRFILQPLIENSLYHGLDDNAIIEVSVIREGNHYVIIQVKDNGRGMNSEEIERLLSDDPGKRKVGLGIGLQYVRRLMEYEPGGEANMKIESILGKGTTFTLRLPIIREE
jgi:two-component system sensor histidine kinase YesM